MQSSLRRMASIGLPVVLGMLNVPFGFMVLVSKKTYDHITIGVSFIVASVCIAVPLVAVAFSCVSKNCCSAEAHSKEPASSPPSAPVVYDSAQDLETQSARV